MVRAQTKDSEDIDMEDATSAKKHVEQEEQQVPADEEAEEDAEEEYEIEAILSARYGHFAGVRISYLSFVLPVSTLAHVFAWCHPGQDWVLCQVERL